MMLMRCNNCGHIYDRPTDIYTCPICKSGPPSTNTIYPLDDGVGGYIHPSILPRLRELGLLDNAPTRDELVDTLNRIIGQT